jgi:hypothetical protein
VLQASDEPGVPCAPRLEGGRCRNILHLGADHDCEPERVREGEIGVDTVSSTPSPGPPRSAFRTSGAARVLQPIVVEYGTKNQLA